MTKICVKCEQVKGINGFNWRDRSKGWRQSQCRKCTKEYGRDYKYRDSQGRANQLRTNTLRRKYGMTLDEWEVLFIKQGGLCAICGDWLRFDGSIAVDHDHITGEVRGLLCRSCNVGIAHLKESGYLMDTARTYLEARK